MTVYKYVSFKYVYGILFLLSAIATIYQSVVGELFPSVLTAMLTIAFFELTKIYNSLEKFINEE